jgi:hypothetical protein
MTARFDHTGPLCTGVDCRHPDHAIDGEGGEQEFCASCGQLLSDDLGCRRCLPSMRLDLHGPNSPELKPGACKHCPTAHYAPDEEAQRDDEWLRSGELRPEDSRLYCPWRKAKCIAQDRRLGFAPLAETKP